MDFQSVHLVIVTCEGYEKFNEYWNETLKEDCRLLSIEFFKIYKSNPPSLFAGRIWS